MGRVRVLCVAFLAPNTKTMALHLQWNQSAYSAGAARSADFGPGWMAHHAEAAAVHKYNAVATASGSPELNPTEQVSSSYVIVAWLTDATTVMWTSSSPPAARLGINSHKSPALSVHCAHVAGLA